MCSLFGYELSHLPYYLNRQIIFLLQFHEVPTCTFLSMQNEMLNELDKMMEDPIHAVNLLPSLSGPDSSLVADMVDMMQCGFSPLYDPFLFSCLCSIRNHHLMQLRKKTRIHVKDGAVLMGGLDETGLLPEGCIFVQLRPKRKIRSNIQNTINDDDEKYKPLIGPVLVAKHPVMHPGDVRMLLAIDVPELRNNKNMILFSQHGNRPEADKMAGSDLDGDQFAVCWDRRLFLKPRRCAYDNNTSVRDLERINHSPMDFTHNKKADEVDKVNDDHLIEHFLNHAKNETLGKISMLWLDYAAIEKNAGCDECLQLAGLHSIAVDFPKNGVPAEIPNNLKLGQTPRPHWREIKRLSSFECDSAVGQLYDKVVSELSNLEKFSDFESLAGRNMNKYGQLLSFFNKEQLRSLYELLEKSYKHEIPKTFGLYEESENVDVSTEDCIDFAESEKQVYEDELIRLMNRYKIHSEGEILTGCIRKFHRSHKKRQHDLAEEVKRQCSQLRRNCRDNFLWHVCKVCVDDFESKIGDSLDEEKYHETLDRIEAEILETRLRISNKSLSKEFEFFTECEAARMRSFATQLASAYYEITYNPEFVFGESDENHVTEQTILFSFPWIVADILAHTLILNDGSICGIV